MSEKEKTIFDEMEESQEAKVENNATSEENPLQDFDEDEMVEDFDGLEDIEIGVSNKSKQEIEEERGVKKDSDGKVLTIQDVSVLPPQVSKTDESGKKVRIEPRETASGNGKFYSTKLKVRFEEDNIVEYYPSIQVWVNDGKLSTNVQLDGSRYNDQYESGTQVAQILRLALQAMYEERNKDKIELERKTINERSTIVVKKEDKPKFFAFSKTVSDQEILEWMKGKKVQIGTSKGKYQGRDWFRNDIKAFK